jgi:hypothetical protein
MATEITLQQQVENGERHEAEFVWEQADRLVLGEINEALQPGQQAPEIGLLAQAQNQLQANLEADSKTMTPDNRAAYEIAMLMLNTPAAAEAQQALDSLPKEQRRTPEARANKRTLIHFNQHFKSTLAVLPTAMLTDFAQDLYEHSKQILSENLSLPILSEQKLGMVAAGMKQEGRFLTAMKAPEAKPKNWRVRSASPHEDALGTDFVVVEDMIELRLDVKTGGSFKRAVGEAVVRGTLNQQQADAALESGFYYRPARSGSGAEVNVCILDMGRLKSNEAVVEVIDQQFAEQTGKLLRKLGKKALALAA